LKHQKVQNLKCAIKKYKSTSKTTPKNQSTIKTKYFRSQTANFKVFWSRLWIWCKTLVLTSFLVSRYDALIKGPLLYSPLKKLVTLRSDKKLFYYPHKMIIILW